MQAFAQLVLHFVLTECRPILVFYVSFWAYGNDAIRYQLRNIILTPFFETQARHLDQGPGGMTPLGSFESCLTMDVAARMRTFAWSYESPCGIPANHKAWGLAVPDHMVWSVGFGLIALICLLFVLALVVELHASGASDFAEGRYLAFSFTFHQSCTYTVFSMMLVACVAVAFLHFVLIAFSAYSVGGTQVMFTLVSNVLMPLLGLAASAISFLRPKEVPNVNFRSVAFLNLRFRRDHSSLFEDNEDFYSRVMHALFTYQYGLPRKLEAMTGPHPNYSIPQEVVEICHPVPAKPEFDGDEMRWDGGSGRTAAIGFRTQPVPMQTYPLRAARW